MPGRPQEPIEDLHDDPFALDDEDDYGIEDDLNDPDRIDLDEHAPPSIGARGMAAGVHDPLGIGTSDFWGGDDVIGRPTSPPIWSGAHLHPNVPQLRVWKLEEGVPVLIGVIDAQASEEDFIRKFFKEMPQPGEGRRKYKIRPLDANNREILQEITLPAISEHHSILEKMRKMAAEAESGGAGGPVIDFSPMNRIIDMMDRRTALMEEDVRSSREREREMWERVSEERMALAENTTRSSEALAERYMNSERQRADHQLAMERQRAEEHQKSLTETFTRFGDMQSQAWERERERAERVREEEDRRWRQRLEEERARREEERREAEDRRHKERMELERRLAREDAERREKWERERREHEERLVRREAEERRMAEEREAARQREHELRLMELKRADQARREEAERRQQMDREHAERVLTLTMDRRHEDSVEGMIERLAKIAAMFGLSPGDVKEMISGGKDDDDGIDWATVMAGGGTVVGQVMEAIARMVEARQAQQVPLIQAPGLPGPAGAPPGLPPGGPSQMQQQPQQQGADPNQQADETGPGPAAVENPAAEAGLSLDTQKRARRALKKMVAELRSKSPEEWEQIVGFAMASEGAIYHYTKAMTLTTALEEVGADAALLERFLAHESCKLIPADVPRA